MEQLKKSVRTIAAIPILGNLFLIAISVFPVLLALIFISNLGLAYFVGGLGVAGVCYFLKAKNVINILAPGRIPMWILGLLIALAGVYLMITN